jgi:peptidoglycan hydrolase-like protein with peptidoglycan-binding domain
MRHFAADRLPRGRRAADPLRPRRYFLGGLAIGVVVMSATGLAAAALIQSPAQVAARSAAPPPSVITAVARWEVLRNAITTQGIVRAARTVQVIASAPYSTLTVTRMPVRLGDMVRPGRVITEIDGRPVLLLRGRLPPYRNLHEGDSGPDVSQLQANLEHAGYADFDAPGYFGPSTSLALYLFYAHLGYQAPRYHHHRKLDVDEPDVYLPRSEVVYIPTKSALVADVSARVGSVVASGTPVLSLATGSPYVTGTLTAHQSSLVRKGNQAGISSASPALTADGVVTRVGPLPSTSAGGYPVRVRSERPLPQRLIGTTVRLTLYSPVTAGPVLTVPLAAIFAGSHHQPTYVVRISARGRRTRVSIFTGPRADGLIAVQSVKPEALRPGDRVLIGHGR